MNAGDALELALAHERRVWEALVAGDGEADESLLASDFLGVYLSGFAGRHEHAAQLADGPSVDAYRIDDPRCIVVSDDDLLLADEARYTRRPGAPTERMFVSSLWSRRNGRWTNTFSQDTPAPG